MCTSVFQPAMPLFFTATDLFQHRLLFHRVIATFWPHMLLPAARLVTRRLDLGSTIILCWQLSFNGSAPLCSLLPLVNKLELWRAAPKCENSIMEHVKAKNVASTFIKKFAHNLPLIFCLPDLGLFFLDDGSRIILMHNCTLFYLRANTP